MTGRGERGGRGELMRWNGMGEVRVALMRTLPTLPSRLESLPTILLSCHSYHPSFIFLFSSLLFFLQSFLFLDPDFALYSLSFHFFFFLPFLSLQTPFMCSCFLFLHFSSSLPSSKLLFPFNSFSSPIVSSCILLPLFSSFTYH